METKRLVDKLSEKNLIKKLMKCPKCGKEYKRIPKKCENIKCLTMLIRPKIMDYNRLKRPHFLVCITEKGRRFVMKRLKEYKEALQIYKIRLNNIRKRYSHFN